MRGRRPRPARSRARKPAARPKRDVRYMVDGLEQRHYDVIGLALIAAAVYMALVLYGGWDGGKVGGWLSTGLEDVAGKVAYFAPIALAGWGAMLISRPVIETPSALNAGGILVIAGLLLAFAAETAGIGPDHPARHDYFDRRVHGRARRRARRGALLVRGDPVPARRRPHPLGPAAVLGRSAADRDDDRPARWAAPARRSAGPPPAPATSPARSAPSGCRSCRAGATPTATATTSRSRRRSTPRS